MMPEFLQQLSRRRSLVLGSGSPRRVKMLGDSGIEFQQMIPHLPEDRLPGEDPFTFGLRMAKEKALAVAANRNHNELVIGGDTVVVLGDLTLEKPVDRDDAMRILTTLSGRCHIVATSIALADHTGLLASGQERTEVIFNAVSEEEIAAYIDTGEPMDKAGAYGIQGMGAFLVDRIEGNLDNVVGLPMSLLDRLAKEVLSHL